MVLIGIFENSGSDFRYRDNLRMFKKLKQTAKIVREVQNSIKGLQIKTEQEKTKNRELAEKFDKVKRELKKIEIVVKGHNIDFREWKEQIISIEKEYVDSSYYFNLDPF